MAISIPNDLPVNTPSKEQLSVINFQEGQRSDLEEDKIPFSSSTEITNMILWKNNLDVRPGTTIVRESTGIFGLGRLKQVGENKLVEFIRSGSDTDINTVDRSSGAIKPLREALSGQNQWSWSNGDGYFYCANGVSNKINKFKTGMEGVIASVADYSGTVAGTVLITDTLHGLSTGDYITIAGTTDYDGDYSVTVVTDNTFYITATWVATNTGIWTADAAAHEEIELDSTDVAVHVAYSEDRLNVLGKNGAYYSRIGAVAADTLNAFDSDMGAYDATTQRFDYGISHGGYYHTGDMLNFTGGVTIGRIFVIFNNEKLQVHELPDPESVNYIDLQRSTLVFEKLYGIPNKNCVKVIQGLVYFTNQDGAYTLDPNTGEVLEIEGDTDYHQTLDWNNGAIGYNKSFSSVLMAGGEKSNNDTIQVYFQKYAAFARMKGWQVAEFVDDNRDLYYRDRDENKIIRCMVEGVYSDEGVPIEYSAKLGVTDGGIPNLYKKLRELFLDFSNWGNSSIYTDVYFDKLGNKGHGPDATFESSFNQIERTLPIQGGNSFGLSAWGRLLIAIGVENTQESLQRNKNRKKFVRMQIGIRGVTSHKISFRRLVAVFTPTLKRVKNIKIV